MVCEYYSRKNGKFFCRAYGLIEVTEDKVRECQSNYDPCFEQAKIFLKRQAERAADKDIGDHIDTYFPSRMGISPFIR
jgi:hypothetical protein